MEGWHRFQGGAAIPYTLMARGLVRCYWCGWGLAPFLNPHWYPDCNSSSSTAHKETNAFPLHLWLSFCSWLMVCVEGHNCWSKPEFVRQFKQQKENIKENIVSLCYKVTHFNLKKTVVTQELEQQMWLKFGEIICTSSVSYYGPIGKMCLYFMKNAVWSEIPSVSSNWV